MSEAETRAKPKIAGYLLVHRNRKLAHFQDNDKTIPTIRHTSQNLSLSESHLKCLCLYFLHFSFSLTHHHFRNQLHRHRL